MTDRGGDRGTGAEPPAIARGRFTPPQLRPSPVERSALVARRLGDPARLGVISGAAGCGKSTLLAQCYHADPFPAWLSLERTDNDPVMLWRSIIAALRTVVEGFGEGYRHRLLTAGASVVDDVVTSVTNELEGSEIPAHLFLDDLHLIDNPVCTRSLHRFLSIVPSDVRVTAASRESSPLPLARFRLQGELVELGGIDLALSSHEAEEVLGRLGVRIDPALLSALLDHTEGWPAGVALAGMVLSRSDDHAGFLNDFDGADESIAGYLASEVLESLDPDVRNFMTSTSVLHRLSGDVCNAVSGRSDSAKVLSSLEQSNMFVIALDRDGVWYRYHHLFAELLGADLQRRRPEDVQGLHERAFDWLRDNGQIVDAVPHGVAAGNVAEAADLVSASWLGFVNSGRLETLRRLLETFEPGEIMAHQPLAITAAMAGGMGGDRAAARRFLAAAEHASFSGQPPDGTTTMISSLALARASLALDGIDRALADGLVAYEAEPPGGAWRALAALDVGLALVMRGDHNEAVPYFEEVERIGDPATRAYALSELSLSRLQLGDVDRAASSASAATDLVTEVGIEDLIMAAVAHAAGALTALALDDDRAARVHLRMAERPMRYVGDALPMDSIHASVQLARVASALGELDLAREYVSDAQRVADKVDDVGAMRAELAELSAQIGTGGGRCDCGSEFTERELEVIALLPSELTIREIGDELFLSRNTIKTYLRRIYHKMHAASREEAVLVAESSGLLPEAGPTSRAGASPG